MKRKRIVFASILKTIHDIRTYHKLARSLVNDHKYEIFIIGFPSAQHITDPEINFIPLKAFQRLSTGRLKAYMEVRRQIKQLQPDLIVINTHELLNIAIDAKSKYGTRIVYDVRENYYTNLKASDLPFSSLLATFTRKKENKSAPQIDHFILAEACYATELPFINHKYTILENKALYNDTSTKTSSLKRLIFTGTLARQTGLIRSIEIAEALHKLDPGITLQVIGNSFNKALRQKLHEMAHSRSWLHLNISEAPLPHEEIQKVINIADAGFVIYEPDANADRKMPTKLYEYLAANLPVILSEDSPWKKFCDKYQAGVCWSGSAEQLFDDLISRQFYTRKPGADVIWVDEADIFRELIHDLLK